MAWITLTLQHVKARLSYDELEAVKEHSEHSQDFDQIQGILDQVTLQVRGKVQGCEKNRGTMGASGTIPDECLFAAVTIARRAILNALPVDLGDTDARASELTSANDFLDSVASCNVVVSGSDGTIPGGGASSICYGGQPLQDFAQ